MPFDYWARIRTFLNEKRRMTGISRHYTLDNSSHLTQLMMTKVGFANSGQHTYCRIKHRQMSVNIQSFG